MNLFSRTDNSILGTWWWTVDRGLLASFMVLIVFGIVLVTTASPPVAEHLGLGSYHFLKRHVVMLVPTLFIMFAVSMLSPRQVWRVASVVFILSLFAMVLVLATGMEIKGARRWIHVAGFSLQPSEFIKPAFAIVSAWFIAMKKSNTDFPGQYVAAGLYFLVIALLLMQPDFGMAFVVTTMIISQIFLAGIPLRLILLLAAMGGSAVVAAYFSFDHVHSRITRFLNPESGDNYQVEQSLEAFRSGGILGTGPGQGVVKLNLPDAHADFIFSVAGEEMGFIFVALLIFIFGFILCRGFNRLMENDNMFAVLAVGGLLTMFGLQALVHMGSALNILPAKGMTLPFISYGGSSVISLGFAMGVVLALTRDQKRSGVARSGLSLRTRANNVKKRI
jgi:cell division protein FtsW